MSYILHYFLYISFFTGFFIRLRGAITVHSVILSGTEHARLESFLHACTKPRSCMMGPLDDQLWMQSLRDVMAAYRIHDRGFVQTEKHACMFCTWLDVGVHGNGPPKRIKKAVQIETYRK